MRPVRPTPRGERSSIGEAGARRAPLPRVFVVTLALLLAACRTPAWYRATADKDVYRTLEGRRCEVPEAVGPLEITEADRAADAMRRMPDVMLDVGTALRLAATGSRDYRSRREDVYLTALTYVGRRHDFDTKFTLGGATSLAADGSSTTATATPTGGLSKALETGGSIVLNLVTTLLKTIRGDPLETAQTILSADVVLPMARGGRIAARENLTQAERDVVYALRDYARFQQEFVVTVASAFYRTVEQRDTLANEDATHQSLALVFERTKAFGPDGAGRLPDFQVDQARQDLLRADDRRIRAKQAYEASLDSLKILLGIPVGTKVVVRDDALEVLRARGLEPPALRLDEATAASMTARLDLDNARDQREDAERKVLVAEDALGVQVDLTLGGALTSPEKQPVNVRRLDPSGSLGLGVDLPLERQAERDSYRSAIVHAARARRAVEGLEDTVLSQVRNAWRGLEQARESYKIQEEGVRVATRRVESADLQLQAGRATLRDVLDAQDSLIEAKNALTQALVDYAVARLEFERDAGVLKPGPLLGVSPVVGPAVPSVEGPVGG